MSGHASRNVLSLIAIWACLLIAVLFCGCGGTSQSSSSNPAATNNPPAGGTQPGGSSGGTGGTSGTGGTTGSGSGGGTGSGATTGATYLYAAVAADTARIGGYKIDSGAASLTDVPGSPFNQQGGAESGVVAVSKNFVYGSEVNSSQGISATITAFRADASTGGLSQIGTPLTFSNTGQALLIPESTGHNLYVLNNAGDILSLTINADGTLTATGSKLHVADQVTSLAISPNGQLAYAAVTNGSVRQGTLTDALIALNRDPNSGTLRLNRQINSNQHLSELQFDTSGTHLLAISADPNTQISVYSVNNSTADATPVAGSPFVVTKPAQPPAPPDYVRSFRLDAASRFTYVLAGNSAHPMTENISVFSFSETSGALAPVQSLDMASGNAPASLVVDPSLVFVVSDSSGSALGTIHVFRRDANTGMLTDSGKTATAQTALWQSAEMRF